MKICGVQRAEDALVAAQAGADYVGMVFVPGRRRRVSVEVAGSIVLALREAGDEGPQVVGLFADQPLDEIQDVLGRCALDMVQLCGSESPEFCARVGVPVLKVVHVPAFPVSPASLEGEDALARISRDVGAYTNEGHLVTLDRKVEGLQGGTGQSFDWQVARALSQEGFRFLLAGGLTPDNVASAIGIAGPWGVDVSSGVETPAAPGSIPGQDSDKIRAFVKAARGTGTEVSGGQKL